MVKKQPFKKITEEQKKQALKAAAPPPPKPKKDPDLADRQRAITASRWDALGTRRKK